MKIDRNFEMVETNGVRLRTVVEGKGPLVILLHGWPQCWYLWRHQIDPLVEAGFKVAVPDQRGFGGSDRPPAIADYNIRTLAADIAGIARALGHDGFRLIGHDWGCVVAWNTALLHEETCQQAEAEKERRCLAVREPKFRVDVPGVSFQRFA